MEAKKLFAAVLLLVLIAPAELSEERCAYMTEIPRPPTPDLPDEDFDGMTWSQRPFLPPPKREEVCMGEWVASISGQQIIYMEEEIEGDVYIAKINYQGTSTPQIGLFLYGSYNMLQPVIRKEGDDWYLVITQRQDYETPDMQRYTFRVIVDGQTLQPAVVLQVVNIDDNAPIIYATTACTTPELGEARLTECVYEVSDIDGEISTRFMTFAVLSERGDDRIFYMQGGNIPNEWFRMLMTVAITEPLDYETNPLHIFTVRASDSLPNNATVSMMVQVQNVEHRPPRWVEVFAVQQFDEKTQQSFQLRAIDGDTGINKPIHYTLKADPADTFFSLVAREGGYDGTELVVAPIDRDYLQQEVFHLSVVAYKESETGEDFSTETNIVIIVNDVNDQRPVPLNKEYSIKIMEETPQTLNLQEFGFHDRDLGENAQYSVKHIDVEPADAAAAFYVSPSEGYQRQIFYMGTQDHAKLDFEVPEFQNITIKVIATDLLNPEFIGEALVHIDLVNWNDELPIFEQASYTASFNETVPKGFHVAQVVANDRDIGDKVVYTLMGNAVDYLSIDEDTGDIYVSVDNAFDYHRQSELFVQVRADDTLEEPYHTTTTQLVIYLEDVNNTPPTLRLPRESPNVEENVPEGFEVSRGVRATDPDTTAHLRFEVDWDGSWASKQGRPTPEAEYRGCVDIRTVYDEEGKFGAASGVIEVKEIRDNITIDFEEFEILYLTVRVVDLNTVDGDDYDEAIFTINIIDMNDNWPIFSSSDSLEFRVRERSARGTVIGSVTATDIDGPLYNSVHYSIAPTGETPDNLVQIDLQSGQISVDADAAIDADEPPRYHLHYSVTASDCCLDEECPPDPTCWNTDIPIEIEIIDTNNKVPEADTTRFDTTVEVWENATSSTRIQQLFAIDLDRDEMYQTVRYQINYAVNYRLRLFFAVDLESGWLTVQYTGDEVLDRDGDEPEHTIFFNLIDNFFTEGDGRRNQNETSIRVVLLDVNDNAPILPADLAWPAVSENLDADTIIATPIIFAPDADEPGTPNSLVGYRVLALEAEDREQEPPELFTTHLIEDPAGNRAQLRTKQSLRGYWGSYNIHLMAYDHGEPPLNTTMWYPVHIAPYNYHKPEFQFPLPGTTIRLSQERATLSVLVTTDGEVLDRIHATDEDGLHAGVVTFEVVGNAEAVEHFTVSNDGENFGTLLLSKIPENINEFQITIRATDGGTDPGPESTDSIFRVLFVPTIGDPVFEDKATTVMFTEGRTGLEEHHELPRAEDPKNYECTSNCHEIYYRIVGGNNDGHFALDAVTNTLSVVSALDREQSRQHTVLVGASNLPAAQGTPLDGSVLAVTVTVIEENPRPEFDPTLYMAGISTLDSIQKELLTVKATHSLPDATVSYSIDWASMEADASLDAVKGAAFALGPASGVLTLNMQPTASMHGMFEFQVLATDATRAPPADVSPDDGGTDRADVKIYLISSRNRVYFRFNNTINQVEGSRSFISSTFSEGFQMSCNIDQVLPAYSDAGAILDDTTEVQAHFIRDDEPVPSEEIEQIRSNTLLLYQIQTRLSEQELQLQDVIVGPAADSGVDTARRALYALAALAAALALLCLALLLFFILRTRSLNRRLEALSMTRYGSADSGLNRAGLAPNTNKHAVEGSNPIWNETVRAPDIDALSDASDNSDLIGIEDLPQFRSSYAGEDGTEDVKTIQRREGPIATHNNDFGFHTSPFSQDFTLRR